MKPRVVSHHLDTCSRKVWRKSIQGKWQKWCVVCQKNNGSATHFFTLSPKPIARFRWKRARLSLFRPQPHLPSFIQIHPTFRDLLVKTTFQIVTIYGDPMLIIKIATVEATRDEQTDASDFIICAMLCYSNRMDNNPAVSAQIFHSTAYRINAANHFNTLHFLFNCFEIRWDFKQSAEPAISL